MIFGGVGQKPQVNALARGVEILIATPGRLLDLMGQRQLRLEAVEFLVLDEADRMLDMGFIPDVERIVKLLPRIRQTLFFSATLAPEIRKIADDFLINPKEISVDPPASPAETVSQSLLRVRGAAKEKRAALRELIRQEDLNSALVFCNRKKDVDILHRSLSKHDFCNAALHGDMVQSLRMETLQRFKDGDVKILVCSDVAARGLDIPAVSHVFNFDVPHTPEDYVHRIGRTGRAGRSGRAFLTEFRKEGAKATAGDKTLVVTNLESYALSGHVGALRLTSFNSFLKNFYKLQRATPPSSRKSEPAIFEMIKMVAIKEPEYRKEFTLASSRV